MGRPTAQEIADIRDQPKIEEAYRKSLTVTEEAPAPASKASAPTPKASTPKKMASGGSASSRADGVASRGKTRGRMC